MLRVLDRAAWRRSLKQTQKFWRWSLQATQNVLRMCLPDLVHWCGCGPREGSLRVLCGLAQDTLLAVELLGAVPAVAPESSSQDVILRRPQAGPRRTTSPTDVCTVLMPGFAVHFDSDNTIMRSTISQKPRFGSFSQAV
ncbi:hypothetical protein CapIbe_001460 [Capra ibex]